MGPSSALPSGHHSCMLQGCPLCGLHGPFYCGGLTTVYTLVGMAGFQPNWLPGPTQCGGCWPVVGMAGCRAQGYGLVPAHWLVEPGPGVIGGGPGVLELVSVCWWAGLGPYNQLWGPGGPRATASLLVGRARSQGAWEAQGAYSSQPAGGQGCVPAQLPAQPRVVPGLVLTSWWAWPGLRANKLEGGLQHGTCQHQCPHGRMSPQRWLLPVSVSPR